jgi:polysaccharide export outer membrane protein
MNPSRHAALLLAACLGSACATTGEFIWVDALKDSQAMGKADYLISPGDTIFVRVFGQDNISGKVKVRTDGRVSMPFVSDLDASGLSPSTLARLIEAQLKTFVVNPLVTILVEEQHAVQVSVLGEVSKPGVYRLDAGQGVLDALAQAGGFTPFADKDRIFVLRRVPDRSELSPRLRIRFRWKALTRAEGKAASFQLRDTDVLVVE